MWHKFASNRGIDMPKTEDTSVSPIKDDTSPATTHNMNKVGITLVVIAGSLVVFMAGVAVERHATRGQVTTAKTGFLRGAQFGERLDGPMRRTGSPRGVAPGRNENRLSGVVTSVDGSNFTLAGGGATNTIQTDNNTKYSGGDKVATNDSVTAIGTTNNGTFTASQIIINP
jgi:hypothetical protein